LLAAVHSVPAVEQMASHGTGSASTTVQPSPFRLLDEVAIVSAHDERQ
jgi:hypothetical protein